MGVIRDFVIRYNPAVDTPQDIARRILYTVLIKNRIKERKPTIMFISGDSGEGKSYGALKLQEELLGLQGLNLIDYLDAINVYTPLEYANKKEKILHDKKYKKINIFCMHEARELIPAKEWYSFLNKSVGDINVLSRSIKPLLIIIISQFIRDISTDIRYTLNFYCKVHRPYRSKTRLEIYWLWKDDSDLEKPKLRKRKLSGYLVYPTGRWQRFTPSYFELNKPSEPVCIEFDYCDREAKIHITKRIIDKLMRHLERELDVENKKVLAMVNYYTKHLEQLTTIGKRIKNKWRLYPEAKNIHDLTSDEAREFEEMLTVELIKRKIIEDKKTNG